MSTVAGKALLGTPMDPSPAASETMVAVARNHGVSPFRQMREMASMRFGPGKLANHEYYSTGVFDPEISIEDKKRYVGKIGSYEINVAASPLKLTETRAFLRDKVMYTSLLRQLDLPTTETQAVAHTSRMFGSLPVLRTVSDVEDFLRNTARYPLFVKPCEGAGSVGSALIKSCDADVLALGNGQHADVNGFAQEVVEDYPEGFIFQTTVKQHPDLVQMTGEAVGTMRVVTTRDETGIAPLYTVWKIPSPRAMSDNFWQSGSMVALIDDQTGQVQKCNIGSGLNAKLLDKHPVSDMAFEGFQIPHWDQIQRVACEGHGLFPEFGIVGWDIAVGPDGPIIIECNDNPFHVLWQLAAGQGIKTPAFQARLNAANSESQSILRGKIDTFQAREKAKRGKS
ncbi:MAG: sugar-transfer associated ATP-grasp domain-containing protein [Paracoccaceae bacterium]